MTEYQFYALVTVILFKMSNFGVQGWHARGRRSS
jgi:hypothetical protein